MTVGPGGGGNGGGGGGVAVPAPVMAMPIVQPMINIVVDVAGGGANVLNGANGVQIVWPGQGIWTIVFGAPVGTGPVIGAAYDINAPAHASGNRTFQGLVDASNAYIFR